MVIRFCQALKYPDERPETVTIGTNELVGTNPKAIYAALNKIFTGDWKEGGIPPFWDGKAAERIIEHIISL